MGRAIDKEVRMRLALSVTLLLVMSSPGWTQPPADPPAELGFHRAAFEYRLALYYTNIRQRVQELRRVGMGAPADPSTVLALAEHPYRLPDRPAYPALALTQRIDLPQAPPAGPAARRGACDVSWTSPVTTADAFKRPLFRPTQAAPPEGGQ